MVLSHLHVDHVGDITGFPTAEFLVQQGEREQDYWPSDPIQQALYRLGNVGSLRSPEFVVTPISGGNDPFGDDTFELLPIPVHTPSHQSPKIELDSRTVILGADIAHRMATGYEAELMAALNWNTDESIESVRQVKRLGPREDAEVYTTHDSNRFADHPASPESLE